MKTLGILATAVLMPMGAWADTISSTGTLVNVPANFTSSTGSNTGTPFWNNLSIDGANMNVGDFLTGSNPSLGSTNYLGESGSYLSTAGPGSDASNFTFLKTAATVQGTLLYSNSSLNAPTPGVAGIYGTQIGLYNVANPNVNETLFSAGTLYNAADPHGVFNNNITPQLPVTVGTWDDYGIYAWVCGYNADGSAYWALYYSNSALDTVDPTHQHFALFTNPQQSGTYYIGFEDKLGVSGTEGAGDYNDVIFKLQVTPNRSVTDVTVTPEPATWSAMALGLLAIGFLGRRPMGAARVS